MQRLILSLSSLVLTVLLVICLTAPRPAGAARHKSYVGTITAISTNALTIHSKSHNTDFHFVIDGNTRFLQHGLGIPRNNFKVGSYVTVSFSPGPNNTMIAYHISLRR